MSKETHKCKENDGGDMSFISVPIFKDSLNDWTIEAGDGYHNIDCITFCPFCGVKLE